MPSLHKLADIPLNPRKTIRATISALVIDGVTYRGLDGEHSLKKGMLLSDSRESISELKRLVKLARRMGIPDKRPLAELGRKGIYSMHRKAS